METQTEKQQVMTPEQMESLMQQKVTQKTWKPTTGGILSIVSGYINMLGGIALWIASAAGTITLISTGFGIVFGILAIAAGILSVIGGGFGAGRRAYPMALIGSIASLFPSPGIIPGSLSLIYVGISRKEFHLKK